MVADVLAKLDQARAMTAEIQTEWRKEHEANRLATAARAIKAWNKRNPDKRRAISSKSAAKRYESTEHSPEAYAFIHFLHSNQVRCPYCLEDLADIGSTLDHIRPLSKGGKHEPNNLILCCRPCNSRKGASLTWPPPYRFMSRNVKHLICDDFT